MNFIAVSLASSRSALIKLGPRFLFTMVQAFQIHQVVPDVIDKLPKSILQVSYSGGLKVEVGNELTPTQVKDKPQVQWDAEAGAYYTLCMTGKINFVVMRKPFLFN